MVLARACFWACASIPFKNTDDKTAFEKDCIAKEKKGDIFYRIKLNSKPITCTNYNSMAPIQMFPNAAYSRYKLLLELIISS